ncbi:hypothetical protein [Fibrobacter sp. UWP2]|uniref:hypothetical protein n=1 Tax=Fibrobacter sp. UWP2 TaxID=1896216 RepID=UPI000920DE1C|nr:hypothetical protein [Fibrobacter sp. UWP2]SHI99378.1 hypothetical protein SAMN05720471_11313 [Fibrobacter sp. UWP2]
MKKSLIFSMALAVMLAACDDESPSSSNPADSEIDSSSSVEETLSSSSVEQGSSSSKGVSSSSKEEAKSSSSVAEQESSSSKGVSSSSKEEAKSSSSVEQESSSTEQKSSSSEKVPSSSEVVEESSSSEPGDTTTVNSSSSAEVVSSSSGPQELDVQVSTKCFADYPFGNVPTLATKAYMQPDSSGRFSGSLWYVVDNCQRLGGTLSKTMSGDTLVLKFVDVEEIANCLCWSDFAISYGSELENIKYIDYSAPYAKHSTYEVVHEPDPGKPSMLGSSSSNGGRDLLSSAQAQQSSSSSD